MPVVAASLACNTIKRVSNCGNVTSESQIFSNPSSRSQKDTLKTERLGNISCNIVGTYSTGDIVIPSPKYIFNKSSTCNSVRLDMTLSGIVFMLVPCRYKNLSLMRNPRHLGTSDIEKLYDKLRYSKFVKEHSSSGIFSSLFQLKSSNALLGAGIAAPFYNSNDMVILKTACDGASSQIKVLAGRCSVL
uniref:Uncharacterized protein n=1 Tax=Oryza meridionalis TaxID=40149 RepID=A0A0E0EQR3_9ORYZ